MFIGFRARILVWILGFRVWILAFRAGILGLRVLKKHASGFRAFEFSALGDGVKGLGAPKSCEERCIL